MEIGDVAFHSSLFSSSVCLVAVFHARLCGCQKLNANHFWIMQMTANQFYNDLFIFESITWSRSSKTIEWIHFNSKAFYRFAFTYQNRRLSSNCLRNRSGRECKKGTDLDLVISSGNHFQKGIPLHFCYNNA